MRIGSDDGWNLSAQANDAAAEPGKRLNPKCAAASVRGVRILRSVEYEVSELQMTVMIGDVFSIKTAKGYGYFQFFGKTSSMGSLIRVLPGIYPKTPPKLSELVNRETNFWTFFPVAGAWKSGVVDRECNLPLPEHARKFPLFRGGYPSRDTEKVETWWLWDGEKAWKIGALTEDQRRLPIRASWNDTLLIKRIEEGWLPEKDNS